jgi:hypothetical protein
MLTTRALTPRSASFSAAAIASATSEPLDISTTCGAPSFTSASTYPPLATPAALAYFSRSM